MSNSSFKTTAVFVFGLVVGYGFFFLDNMLEIDYLTIRVMNDTDCEAQRISILYKDMSFVVEEDQINREPTLMAVRSDTMIRTLRESSELTEYSVLIEFANCPSIQSPVRRVEKGSILYESVRKDGTIDHQVRG